LNFYLYSLYILYINNFFFFLYIHLYNVSNINLSNNMQKIIVENYFKYCEIIHKTNIDIFLILPNKELSKFNLDIANVKDILTRYGKLKK